MIKLFEALRERSVFKISLSNLIIGFTCLAFGYLFKLLVVYIVVTGQGECLHSFWLGSDKYFNPYMITVVCVSAFMVFGLLKTWLTIKTPKESRNNLVFYLGLCIVMAVWLYILNGMWQAFEYEKGNIAAEQYYSDNLKQFIYIWEMETLHVCRGGN